MSELRIGTREDQTSFRPGDAIEGAVGWEMTKPAKAIEVRLFWYTKGKGMEDVEVVDKIRFEAPEQQGAQPFRFKAPEQPYSFSGRLISLIWSLEVVVEPGGEFARRDIVIAPTGAEVLLGDLPGAKAKA